MKSATSAMNLTVSLLLLGAALCAAIAALCHSRTKHSLQPLHSGTCVPDAHRLRQVRLRDAQLLTGAIDLQSCVLACAMRPTVCAVVQFRFVARICEAASEPLRPASGSEATDTATRGDCVATLLRRDHSGATGWQFASRLAAFFDFRVSDRNLGYVGRSSPLSAPARFAGNAARNSSGATLPGSLDSFVSIGLEAPGFQAFASPSRESSIFFSIRGMPSLPPLSLMHLLRVVPSGSAISPFSVFAYFYGSSIRFANLFTQTVAYESSLPLSPEQKLSIGWSFSNSSAAFSVFFNGSIYAVRPYSSSYQLRADIVFNEILLGTAEESVSSCLRGTIVCFAFAPVALLPEEFQSVDSAC